MTRCALRFGTLILQDPAPPWARIQAALEIGCPVVTRNARHIEAIEGLTVRDRFAVDD